MNQTCDFSTLQQLLDTAAGGNFSINSTILTCPDICELAWGSGNPDLSGIGVSVEKAPVGNAVVYVQRDGEDALESRI